jgi:glucose-1-phosphate thymidylyltransferase
MAHLYGIAIVEAGSSKILDFQEKPKEPKSTLAATAVYFYPKEKLKELREYMETDLSKDAPGNFIKWLSTKEDVYGYVFSEKWYDIGDKSSLKKADKELTEKEKGKE